MMSLAYTLSDPCDVDNGELAGLSPAECFVLGVEWAYMIRELEAVAGTMTLTIHQQNAPRLREACQRRGRACKVKTICSTWAELHVGAKGAN